MDRGHRRRVSGEDRRTARRARTAPTRVLILFRPERPCFTGCGRRTDLRLHSVGLRARLLTASDELNLLWRNPEVVRLPSVSEAEEVGGSWPRSSRPSRPFSPNYSERRTGRSSTTTTAKRMRRSGSTRPGWRTAGPRSSHNPGRPRDPWGAPSPVCLAFEHHTMRAEADRRFELESILASITASVPTLVLSEDALKTPRAASGEWLASESVALADCCSRVEDRLQLADRRASHVRRARVRKVGIWVQ